MRLLGALTSSYLLFWSPLFLVTVFSWGDTWDTGTESTPHQVTLHLCYAHAGVAPLVQLLLHPAPALTRLRSQVTTTDQCRYNI